MIQADHPTTAFCSDYWFKIAAQSFSLT